MNELYFEGSKAVKGEAEAALIGTVILHPECLGDFAHISSDDFYYSDHRAVWKILKYLSDTDQPIDLPTITSAMKDAGKTDEIGPSVLVNLADAGSVPSTAHHYAKIVKDAAMLRRGIETVNNLQNRLSDASPGEAEAALNEATKALEEVRPDASKGLKHISEIEEKVFESLDKKDEKVNTGFPLYDQISGGIISGELYVLAGRPSVGKTAKALQMVGGIARQGKGAVLLWSQEMDDVEVLKRILSKETGVPYNFLTKDTDKLEPKHLAKLREKYKELNALPIYIEDAAGTSIHKIKAAVKSFRARKGKIAAVFVDYLQIMDIPVARGETEATAIAKVVQEAKNIARKEKLTFVLLSQMNRDIEEADRKPRLRDLKGSGGIEQAADVVEFLYEHVNDLDEFPKPGEKRVRSLIAKARRFSVGEIKCTFEGWCQKFREDGIVQPGEDEKKLQEKKGRKGAA